MTDVIVDRVRQLAPAIADPSKLQTARQRRELMLAVTGATPRAGAYGGTVDERAGGRHRRSRRHWAWLPTGVVAVAVTCGGIAAAFTVLGPNSQQAQRITNAFQPDSGAGLVPGTRPTLNSESVLCQISGNPNPPGSTQASDAPMTEPLTAEMLVRACQHSDVVNMQTSQIPVTPATLCVTTQIAAQTGEPTGWPVVVLGSSSCSGVGYALPPSDVMAQVNRRRSVEATIIAIPEPCPTKEQTIRWVREQLATLRESMKIVEAGIGVPGGRCYLPTVHWAFPPTGGPTVEVNAHDYPG
jgi:hypothetical protein